MSKLRDEAILSITGEGRISIDIINTLIERQEKSTEEARAAFAQAKKAMEDDQKESSGKAKEIELLLTWADAFDTASIEHQRMILSSIIDRITVSGDDEVDIQLKLDTQQYLRLVS